jgi:hypothetical protein
MRRYVLLVVFLCICSIGFSQEINFLNDLADKQKVTFGDAVRMYMYTLGKAPTGFEADVNTLKGLKMLKAKSYVSEKPLRRGMLALMVARHLKLKNSLFFLIFDTERYAHRACVAEDIMASTSSEFDTLTGDELMEVMKIVAERMEEKK